MTQESQTETEDFAQLFEQSVNLVKEGEVVIGTVLRADPDNVLIDIGYKSEGLIPTYEFADAKGIANIEPGQQVEVMIEQTENDDGLVMLSKEKADRVRVWEVLSKAHDDGEVVEVNQLCSSFNYYARVLNGLGVELDPGPVGLTDLDRVRTSNTEDPM